MTTNDAQPPAGFPGEGGAVPPPPREDPRSAMMKEMLLNLQTWIEALPSDEDGYGKLHTSTIMHHQTAVGMFLSQLEQFGMLLQGQEDALSRITNIGQQVKAAGDSLNRELDLRIPPRIATEDPKEDAS